MGITNSRTVPHDQKNLVFSFIDSSSKLLALTAMVDEFNLTGLDQAKAIATTDQQRLTNILESLKTQTTLSTLTQILPNLPSGDLHQIASELRFDHQALLLASDPILVYSWLKQAGFSQGTVIPSVNVAKRLEKRYQSPCPVAILRTGFTIPDPDQRSPSVFRQIELFLPVPQPGSWSQDIVLNEQNQENELHTAFIVTGHSQYQSILSKLQHLGLVLDGAQTVNPVENSSTQYLKNPHSGQRFELIKYGVL